MTDHVLEGSSQARRVIRQQHLGHKGVRLVHNGKICATHNMDMIAAPNAEDDTNCAVCKHSQQASMHSVHPRTVPNCCFAHLEF